MVKLCFAAHDLENTFAYLHNQDSGCLPCLRRRLILVLDINLKQLLYTHIRTTVLFNLSVSLLGCSSHPAELTISGKLSKPVTFLTFTRFLGGINEILLLSWRSFTPNILHLLF